MYASSLLKAFDDAFLHLSGRKTFSKAAIAESYNSFPFGNGRQKNTGIYHMYTCIYILHSNTHIHVNPPWEEVISRNNSVKKSPLISPSEVSIPWANGMSLS